MTHSIGINTFSVFKSLYEDYFGTLEKLATIGYENIELLSFNFLNNTKFSDVFPAAKVKAKFQALKINPIASHEMLPRGTDLLNYDWESVIKYNSELGCQAIVIPWLWFNNREDTLRVAEQMNTIGRLFKKSGLQLYYHNHGHEFRKTGDSTFFDLLAENTDPDHLKFELDLIWIALAGIDPITVMEKLGSRADLTHQNDSSKNFKFDPEHFFARLEKCDKEKSDIMPVYTEGLSSDSFTDLGQGSYDFAGFYKKVNDLGTIRCTIVENETTFNDKLIRVEKDYKFIKQFI
jgi:sugar phosphate isomerase/epimerase